MREQQVEIPGLVPCFLIPNALKMFQAKEKDHLAPCHLHLSEGLRIKSSHRKEVLVLLQVNVNSFTSGEE